MQKWTPQQFRTVPEIFTWKLLDVLLLLTNYGRSSSVCFQAERACHGALRLQRAQSSFCSCTLGPNVGRIYILGASGFGRLQPGLQGASATRSAGIAGYWRLLASRDSRLRTYIQYTVGLFFAQQGRLHLLSCTVVMEKQLPLRFRKSR